MNRTGEHGDALTADLVAKVLAGDADGTSAGRSQHTPIQVLPLLSHSDRASISHRDQAGTSVLLTVVRVVKRSAEAPIAARAGAEGRWHNYRGF